MVLEVMAPPVIKIEKTAEIAAIRDVITVRLARERTMLGDDWAWRAYSTGFPAC
jgi:hypothetical protein